MSDKEKDYFVPEQLDDNDFEREKIEAKKARKEKKFELNKKIIVKIISIVLVIALIIVGIYLYLNPMEKKATAPEQAAKDFCAYFNSGNWKQVNKMMDLKGYYILGAVLGESDYPKFDKSYRKFDDDSQKYIEFKETMDVLSSIDSDVLNSFASIQIKLRSVESCNLIQGTDSLYKLRVNFDYIYDGQSENLTDVIYISNASGEYKMVFGEWIQTVLNLYQSVYMFQSSYGY